MKIYLDMCHGCGQDRGANSYANEEVESDKLTVIVKSKLESLGHTVNRTRPNESWHTEVSSCEKRAEMANNWGADIFVSVHNNAGGGYGAEAYTYNGEKTKMATRYLQYILDHGGSTHCYTHKSVNDAIQNGNHLIVINQSEMEACLLENFYVDTQSDFNFFKTNIEMFANAIVYGITGVDLGKKQTSNNNVKVEYDMNKIVVYTGDLDSLSAIVVGQRHKCPVMKLDDFKSSGIKAKEVIQIGGKAGSNRYTSFKDAAKLV